MVSTRATGELHIGEIQAILQKLYPGVEVAGDTGGESTGPHADTALSREELCACLPPPSRLNSSSSAESLTRRLACRGMEFHSIEDTLRSTVDSAIELGFVTPKGKVDHTLMRWNDRLQPLLVGAGKL